jgi:hypothetical protein
LDSISLFLGDFRAASFSADLGRWRLSSRRALAQVSKRYSATSTTADYNPKTTWTSETAATNTWKVRPKPVPPTNTKTGRLVNLKLAPSRYFRRSTTIFPNTQVDFKSDQLSNIVHGAPTGLGQTLQMTDLIFFGN